MVAKQTAASLGSALREAVAILHKSGATTPELDARLLACHATGLDPAQLIAASRDPLAESAASALAELVARRAGGEPVARILGRREFWGIDFELNPHTLVPRPDTETLVESALALIDAGPGRDAPLRIADLGTGSGCLLVALLLELPFAFGVGLDISHEAAAMARRNADNNGLGLRCSFAVGSWAEAVSGRFDVIVTNPPYIATGALDALAAEVNRHDPMQGLDGGPDGLQGYRKLLPSAVQSLRPDGVFLAEVGNGQATAVTRLIVGAGLASEGTWRDLAGLERVVAGRKLPRDGT